MIRRALNQKTARDLSFVEFLDLAQSLGCLGVEPRNDLGQGFFDGIAPDIAASLAQERGLRFLGLSEVYGFNVWDDTRAQQIAALFDIAEAAGAETISLIPSVDDRPTRALRDVMRDISALRAGRKVLPLIEPIGFESSTVPRKAELVDAIEAVGGTHAFKLVHDTFQHAISGEKAVFPAHTAIVHISGISAPDVTLDAEQDGARVLVDALDHLDNLGQIHALQSGGYQGALSFECTLPALIARPERAAIAASFDWIAQGLNRL